MGSFHSTQKMQSRRKLSSSFELFCPELCSCASSAAIYNTSYLFRRKKCAIYLAREKVEEVGESVKAIDMPGRI
ncbi:hypothetical protein ANANG_G00107640 [Anguilla anguilla]|uniref:Uncharacterized protein n=1 Tax=Anguilla anguilla TaxID=7936 RepID=A0A9D3MI47_ANGAN|nr:hypothetical protein ANANG_G00107640 [Anguilla anguilla]